MIISDKNKEIIIKEIPMIKDSIDNNDVDAVMDIIDEEMAMEIIDNEGEANERVLMLRNIYDELYVDNIR